MSLPASSEPKTLPSTRALLHETFRLYLHHASTYLGYAGWMLFPLVGIDVARITLGSGTAAEPVVYALNGLSLALNAWVFASIAEATRMIKTHGKIAPTSLPILTAFLVFIAYSLLVFAGLMVFLLPGILFMTWFAYAPLVAVLERSTFFTAFLESKNLVRGLFWPTFIRMWGMYLVLFVIYLLLVLGLSIPYPAILSLDVGMALPLPADTVLSIAEIVLTPVLVIYLTLLYLARKNG